MSRLVVLYVSRPHPLLCYSSSDCALSEVSCCFFLVRIISPSCPHPLAASPPPCFFLPPLHSSLPLAFWPGYFAPCWRRRACLHRARLPAGDAAQCFSIRACMSAPAAAGPVWCGSRSIAGVALVVSLLSACAAFARQPQPVQQWSVGQRPGVLAEAEDARPSLSRIASGRAARHAPTPPQAEVPPPSPPPGAPPSPLSEAGTAATGALASTQRPRACEAWCDSKYIGAHCQKRKCHGCAFCRPSPPTVRDPTTPPHEERPQSDGAPPTQGGGGSELQRPESECLSSAEDGGPPSFDLVALILSSNQPGPEPERRRHAVRNSWAREGLRLGGPGADAPPCSLRFLFVLGGAAAAQLRGCIFCSCAMCLRIVCCPEFILHRKE